MAAPTIRGSTAPVSGLSTTSPGGTTAGDLVVCITWERSGAGSPTHTVQTGSGFVEIRSHAHDDGSTDGRLSCAYKIAGSSGANSYQAYTTSGSGTVYTGCIVLTAGTYTVTVLPPSNSDSGTTNAVPNPPSVAGLTGDYLMLAIAGWHLGSAVAVAATSPAGGYSETWEIAGSPDVELSLATKDALLLVNATEDPGTFNDDVAPNGTARMTVAIRSPVAHTTSAAVDGFGVIFLQGATREVPAGALAIDGGGTADIADATVSSGETEHFTSLYVDGDGSVVIAASTREIPSGALAVDGGGSVAVAASTREVPAGSLAIEGAGSVAIAAATQNHLGTALAVTGAGTLDIAGATISNGPAEHTTSLALDASGALTIAASTRETTTSAEVAGESTLTIAGSTRGLLASASIEGAGEIAVSLGVQEHSTDLTVTGIGILAVIAGSDRLERTGNTGRKRRFGARRGW